MSKHPSSKEEVLMEKIRRQSKAIEDLNKIREETIRVLTEALNYLNQDKMDEFRRRLEEAISLIEKGEQIIKSTGEEDGQG
jgi:hypothetical protein